MAIDRRVGRWGLAILLGPAVLGLALAPASSAAQDVRPVAAPPDALAGSHGGGLPGDGTSALTSSLEDARAAVAAAEAQVAASRAAVARLDADLAAARAHLDALTTLQRAEAARLFALVRLAYEQGLDAPLVYVLEGASLGAMVQRAADVSRIADAMASLATRLRRDRATAEAEVARLTAERARLTGLEAQARAAVLVARDAADRLRARIAAASVARAALSQTSSRPRPAQDPIPAPSSPPAPSSSGVTSPGAASGPAPTPGSPAPPASPQPFSPDTDLTRPSGLTAGQIDAFLAGTPLGGLGANFMAAERDHHVSARFLVAVAVNESAWGRSRLAREKHNLFGWGADDRDPYGDAASFPSFAACIDAVSAAIHRDYLSPNGRFYHGPTLRGVAVLYASDPAWANKIAAIAREIG